jgi:hypothetical protein
VTIVKRPANANVGLLREWCVSVARIISSPLQCDRTPPIRGAIAGASDHLLQALARRVVRLSAANRPHPWSRTSDGPHGAVRIAFDLDAFAGELGDCVGMLSGQRQLALDHDMTTVGVLGSTVGSDVNRCRKLCRRMALC